LGGAALLPHPALRVRRSLPPPARLRPAQAALQLRFQPSAKAATAALAVLAQPQGVAAEQELIAQQQYLSHLLLELAL